MRTALSVTLLLCVVHLAAQRCVTSQYIQEIKSSDISAERNIEDAESFIITHSKAFSVSTRTLASEVIRIPVVVHVLYNSASQNISVEQITTQIQALNRDFRKQNSDTANTPERFKQFAADVQLEFVLATADPKGRPTTGVVRKYTSTTQWTMDDRIKFSSQGGDDAWDTKSYLNIWVGNTRTLLGYSSVPGGPEERDGVVINTTAFGTINVTAPYNLGRTAVHEVGHWLGLKHIWGDTYCGNDEVDDTPQQAGFTSGCPTGFRESCNNSESGGDMYMNYMDFTNDECLNLFTEGQNQRMRSVFNEGGPRYPLIFSKGLDAPWSEELPTESKPSFSGFLIYPNPAANEIFFEVGGVSWIGKEVKIININGVTVRSVRITSKSQQINLQKLSSGVYFVQVDGRSKKFIKM
ncbi:MAG: T9SS type A sorting domain-containing protein [Chitinophagaceae bacterium]|nr:T9SS type A sorting domain-containing protein [Chitinophagaceae bacterium]